MIKTVQPQVDFFATEGLFDYIYQLVSVKEPDEYTRWQDLYDYQQVIISKLYGGVGSFGGPERKMLNEVLYRGTVSNRKVFTHFANILDLRVAGGTIDSNRYFVITYIDDWWFIAYNDDYVCKQLDVTSFKSVMAHPGTKIQRIAGPDKTAFMHFTTKILCG